MIAAVGLLLAAALATGSTRYDPRLRFQTISTPRFDIHFHQGEEALAQRLARLVEEVATTIDGGLGPASGRVQVILVDQSDLSNGWATPVPYNTIELAAAVPPADSIIGNTDDWLRLVFTHEYTHIVHLSRSGGWIGGLRRVFGRLPLLYPNTFTPIWQIEGLATWQESAQTGVGRVPAADFRLILQTAAAGRRLERLDRASSRLVDWPSGTTPYLYGAYFHQFLAERYGAEALRRLTDETAKQVPYFGARAFRKVFGRSLGQLWSDFASSAPHRTRTEQSARRLTDHGFFVSGPRFVDASHILYSLDDPHGFPALRELDLTSGQSRKVATRYFGDQVAVAGDRAVFDQIEIVHDVGLQSDLYSAGLRDGRVQRITVGARALDPDVSPDGSKLVFVVQRADRRELATAPLAPSFQWTPRALASAPDQHFAGPRWSPDGTRIVAERRVHGGASEIVLVDAESGELHVLVGSGRNAGPVWSPDGSTIYFAAASSEHPFQICSISVAGGPVRRLEGTGASAQSPAVSPDGRSLVFVGYTADGYDLFQLPLDTARWATLTAAQQPAAESRDVSAAISARRYSPLATVLPRFWTPTLESDQGETVVGAATASVDALGRHAYGVEAGWAISRARPDWQVGYAYDRWRPTFYLVTSDDTDPWRGGERRIVEADAGMLLVSRRIRWSQSVLAELHGSSESFACDGAVESCRDADGVRLRRTSLRTGWSFNAARMFGYSISPEEGGRLTTTLEGTRTGSLGGLTSLAATFDARRYVRAWPRHAVLAVRGAAAASWGDVPLRREFSASGSDPQPGGFRFGTDAIGLIRGLDPDRLFGHRAAVLNVDYRVPVAHVERGRGTLPFFLRNVHAAVFVDAGQAWSNRFRAADIRSSVGAELSLDTVLGYFLPVTFSGGAAWRRGPDPDDRGFAVFARVGRAF
ncbi:MAG: BamA/TamA family outer membrane protein [Vicinamibacterales bacterium]